MADKPAARARGYADAPVDESEEAARQRMRFDQLSVSSSPGVIKGEEFATNIAMMTRLLVPDPTARQALLGGVSQIGIDAVLPAWLTKVLPGAVRSWLTNQLVNYLVADVEGLEPGLAAYVRAINPTPKSNRRMVFVSTIGAVTAMAAGAAWFWKRK